MGDENCLENSRAVKGLGGSTPSASAKFDNYGELTERLMCLFAKQSRVKAHVGSNPTLTAIFYGAVVRGLSFRRHPCMLLAPFYLGVAQRQSSGLLSQRL